MTPERRRAALARLHGSSAARTQLSHWDVPKECPTGTVDRQAGTSGTAGTVGTRGTVGTAAAVQMDVADPMERAAVVEHDGSIPRIFADEFARLQQWCPSGVPEPRWRQFINDGGAFLDRRSGEALALGWKSSDLFGLDPVAPMARYDRMGLLWLLKGRAVSALNAAEATITGGQVFRRTPAGSPIQTTTIPTR